MKIAYFVASILIIIFAALVFYTGAPSVEACLILAVGLFVLAIASYDGGLTVKIDLLCEAAKLPTYGSEGAACFDLYAAKQAEGLGRVTVSTGLAMAIPKGYGLFIKPRSGSAFKNRVHAFAGTIDSDYRGEIKVLLVNEWPCDIIKIDVGDRIAQAMILPVPKVKYKVVRDLGVTKRGKNGFGSTGI